MVPKCSDKHPAGESQASDHPNSNANDDGDHHKATPGTCLQSTQESTLDSRSLSFVFGPEPKFLLCSAKHVRGAQSVKEDLRCH